MKAIVDQDICTGCGVCVDVCPEVFELKDDGLAEVKLSLVPEELTESCQEATDGCPVEAITIEED